MGDAMKQITEHDAIEQIRVFVVSADLDDLCEILSRHCVEGPVCILAAGYSGRASLPYAYGFHYTRATQGEEMVRAEHILRRASGTMHADFRERVMEHCFPKNIPFDVAEWGEHWVGMIRQFSGDDNQDSFNSATSLLPVLNNKQAISARAFLHDQIDRTIGMHYEQSETPLPHFEKWEHKNMNEPLTKPGQGREPGSEVIEAFVALGCFVFLIGLMTFLFLRG